jgi:hypothetical protein
MKEKKGGGVRWIFYPKYLRKLSDLRAHGSPTTSSSLKKSHLLELSKRPEMPLISMDTSHYITRFHIVRLIIWQGSNDAIHPQDERRILKVAAFVAIRSSNLSQSEQCPYPAKTYEQDLKSNLYLDMP